MKGSSIYRTIAQLCPALEPPPQLARFGSALTARRGSPDAEHILSVLRRDFRVEDLLRAGVVQGDGDQLRLHPHLANPAAVFLPLTAGGECDPYELITADGCVSGSGLPITALALDKGIRTQFERHEPLLVCTDVADCGVLRALGLAASTANGLLDSTPESVDLLCRTFGWPRKLRPPAQSNGRGQPMPLRTLTLVAWRPHKWSLDGPSRIDELIATLKRLQTDLEIGLPKVTVWRPTGAALERFEFVARHLSLGELKARLLRSIGSAKALLPGLAKLPRLAATYQQFLDREVRGPEVHQRFEGLMRRLREVVVLPLMDQLAEEQSIDERVRRLNLAVLCEVYFQRTLPLLQELQQKTSDDKSWSAPAAMGSEVLQMLTMSRELRRWISTSRPRRRRK